MTKDGEHMSKEAMKLALEALEDFEDAIRYDNEQDDIGARVCCDVLSYNPHTKDCKVLKAITALREALEQPAPATELREQEPVYFCDYGCEGWGKVDAAMAAENLACGMTVEAYYTSHQHSASV